MLLLQKELCTDMRNLKTIVVIQFWIYVM